MLGNQILPGIGGRILSAVGRRVGKEADEAIGFSPSSDPADGPRLESLRMQDSRYGAGIPKTFGRARVAGNVIWVSDLIETAHEDSSSGGKGGAVGGILGGNSRTTYTYSVHCAIAVAAGEIGGIASIWADSKVIYSDGIWDAGVVAGASVYCGTSAQAADPLLQSWTGADTPAYRGVAYVVLESLQLREFGNRLPNLTFEITPKREAAQPNWLGQADPALLQPSMAAKTKTLAPLISERGAIAARRAIVCGYVEDGANKRFQVVEYDVTDDVPAEIARTSSAAFAASSISDMAWAFAADERFVAIYAQDNGGSPTHYFAIYDSESRQFGDVLGAALPFSVDYKQVAWIDPLHFVVTDASGGKRGVRLLARAGRQVIDRGFYDVWGTGSAASRAPLLNANFTPLAGGLVYYAVNQSPYFNTLYACHLTMRDGALAKGAPYTVASGLSTGSGSSPSAAFLRSDEGEWTLFFSTVLYMRMISFRPAPNAASVTRPWQSVSSLAVPVCSLQHPIASGDRIAVLQRGSGEDFYRLSEILLRASDFLLETDAAQVGGAAQVADIFSAISIGRERLLLTGLSGPNAEMNHAGIARARPLGDDLASVVEWILSRAGYSGGDIDASELAGVAIDGYVMPDPTTAAAALAPLQVFEPFDLAESDGVLKAVRRGVASVGAVLDDGEFLEPPNFFRAQELDLPIEATVEYIDASRDYEIGSQRARRLASRGAKAATRIALPLVCSAARAKKVAEERLFSLWGERERVSAIATRSRLNLEPADVVEIGGRAVRITSTRLSEGALELRGVAAVLPPSSAAAPSGADGGYEGGSVAASRREAALYLMDLPLLRAEDDEAGVYAAATCDAASGWGGASIWRSADGANFGRVAGLDTAATAGAAVTALADASAHYMDRGAGVKVQLARGELASCSEADLLNGANAAMLGGEILQFQTATLIEAGCYVLSDLLRGRRGTEAATAGHAIGDAFVLLTKGAVGFIPALLSDRGRSYLFRALAGGQSLGDAADMSFTYSLNTLCPLPVAHIAGSRASGTGSDLTITWKRRARRNGDWIDNVDVPLDEPSEQYDVEIMNGSAVVRTFSAVASPSLIYTAAEQTADWGGSPPAQFTVKVYQLSARYGRGKPASAMV